MFVKFGGFAENSDGPVGALPSRGLEIAARFRTRLRMRREVLQLRNILCVSKKEKLLWPGKQSPITCARGRRLTFVELKWEGRANLHPVQVRIYAYNRPHHNQRALIMLFLPKDETPVLLYHYLSMGIGRDQGDHYCCFTA